MNFDRTTFFSFIRTTLPANKQLTQSQVNGMNILLAEGERRNLSPDWIAYVLATSWHESAFTMQPVAEYGGTVYLKSKKYYPYYGRGYIQLTWNYNYKIMGDWIGQDLLNNPDLALQPAIAVQIIYEGMIRGMFTAKKLSDYIDNVTESDEAEFQEFLKARAIVNGSDHASDIAGYAIIFEHALVKSQTIAISPKLGLDEDSTDQPQSILIGPPPHLEYPPPFRPDQTSLWGLITTAFIAIIGILNSLNPILQGMIVIFVLSVIAIITYRMLFPSQNQILGMLR